MKDEEPMLLDAASLRLAWSGGTARAYRYTRLVMYEALRGEQAVELIEHAGTSKADRPAWQMCAAIDDTIVRVAAIAEDADAQTMAAMLAVQREARRAGTDLRLVERTDAFGGYEATRDAMVIERARAETRLRNGNPMDTPRGERSGGRRRLVQLGEGEKIIVKLEMRPNENEETTTEEVEVREHVWAAPSWTRGQGERGSGSVSDNDARQRETRGGRGHDAAAVRFGGAPLPGDRVGDGTRPRRPAADRGARAQRRGRTCGARRSHSCSRTKARAAGRCEDRCSTANG